VCAARPTLNEFDRLLECLSQWLALTTNLSARPAQLVNGKVTGYHSFAERAQALASVDGPADSADPIA
jgi:hypothetical protein